MAKLAIYAGHGGNDSGAVGYEVEKELTLEVANGVASILSAAGHEVIQNRTEDVNRSIAADAKKANAAGVDYVIEIHFNASNGEGHGTECIGSICGGESTQIAQAIVDRIASLGFRNRGVKTRKGDDGKDYFGIIRQTNAPAVIVEVCFVDNADDMGLYNSIPNIPNHIADAIHNYVGGGTPAPSPDPQPAPSSNPTAICNADILRVRSGAGMGYPVVFKIAEGNVVDILDRNGDWDYIECLHGRGWAKNCYLDAQ